MRKEIDGYYNENNKPVITPDHPLSAIFEAIRSHDGWLCPHCYAKSNIHKEEMSSQRYMELLHEYTPMNMRCDSCDKEYYLKCCMTLKYYTCVDKIFGENDAGL